MEFMQGGDLMTHFVTKGHFKEDTIRYTFCVNVRKYELIVYVITV